jgi:hypothetical protein
MVVQPLSLAEGAGGAFFWVTSASQLVLITRVLAEKVSRVAH